MIFKIFRLKWLKSEIKKFSEFILFMESVMGEVEVSDR